MKAALALSSLAGLSLANFETITNTLVTLNGDDRAGEAALHALISQIQGYACWCFFDGEHRGKAKGLPIDEFDTACRTLNWGYQCAVIDDSTANDPCVPWEVAYTAPTIIPNQFGQDFGVLCGDLNPTDPCAEHTCIVESIFISTINALLVQQGKAPVAEYRHNHVDPGTGLPTFSHIDSCPGFSHDGVLVAACCGDYENQRKPFNKGENDERACCNGITFLTSIFQCCGPPINAPQVSCVV